MIPSVGVQLALEQWLSLTVFWGIVIILICQWGIMTFIWPRYPPEWAVWAETSAFLLLAGTRLLLYYVGERRFPFPIGAIINILTLWGICYFGYVYLWKTWIRGEFVRDPKRCRCHCPEDDSVESRDARSSRRRWWGP